jgi:hypothetical protein
VDIRRADVRELNRASGILPLRITPAHLQRPSPDSLSLGIRHALAAFVPSPPFCDRMRGLAVDCEDACSQLADQQFL